MYRSRYSLLAPFFVASLALALHAEMPEDLIERGKLIFSDDFNRSDKGDAVGELGNGWETNTENGNRTDLQNDALLITKGKAANHSLSVRHVNPFDDGVVMLRFQLFDKHGLKVNFNDKNAKDVTWAGHIARVVVQPHAVTIQDDKTGYYDLGVRKKRLSEDVDERAKAELATFLASKQARFKTSIEFGTWHELTIVNIGSKIEVYIDGESVGSFSSAGLDHHVKQYMALGVSGKVAIDDVRVWSLD